MMADRPRAPTLALVPRRAIRVTMATLALATASYAVAQTLEASVGALEKAKREAILANQRSAQYEALAERATNEAARARAARAAVASRIQSAEQDVAAAQTRIGLVEQLRARQRARLAEQQGSIVRLVAALQTMSRRPPALALIQRGSVDDLVHVRALLGSQIPLVRARTAGLRAEVARGVRLARQARLAAASLHAGEVRLRDERTQLARLEAQHLIRSQALTDSAMHETDRAMALGEDARDIVDLITKLDSQAALRDRLAALPGPLLRPMIPGLAQNPRTDGAARIATALPYRLPVVGSLVTGLGELSEAGVKSRGLTLAAAPGAQVVAPAAGRVSYAGPFRGYGQIVIIDHGGGWTSLITSLASLTIGVGDTVDRGSPLGRTAARRSNVTVELRRGGQPIDITPLVSG